MLVILFSYHYPVRIQNPVSGPIQYPVHQYLLTVFLDRSHDIILAFLAVKMKDAEEKFLSKRRQNGNLIKVLYKANISNSNGIRNTESFLILP